MNDLTTIDKSGLDKIDSSPLDYWYAYLRDNHEPYFPSKETTFDIAFRCAVLEPEEFAKTYVKIPKLNLRTNLGKAELERITESTSVAGHIIITEDDYNDVMAMKSELEKHPLFKDIFSKGYPNKQLDFEEENSGVLVNFKPHWISASEPLIVSLSSTKDATTDNVAKDMWLLKQHKKSALQIDGMRSITDVNHAFLFVVVERNAPYKINMFYPDEQAMALGMETYKKNCAIFKECVSSGKWPGLSPEITAINLPNWAYKNQ
jgi:hypothetical protein